MAIRVNVVRQTVSKWEKGLSVPDAEVLQRIAEVLEVGVNELLGADLTQNADNNEVAQQLARINEQLAIKNRRWHRFWKAVGIIVLVSLIFTVLGYILFSADFSMQTSTYEVQETMVDGEYIEN